MSFAGITLDLYCVADAAKKIHQHEISKLGILIWSKVEEIQDLSDDSIDLIITGYIQNYHRFQ